MVTHRTFASVGFNIYIFRVCIHIGVITLRFIHHVTQDSGATVQGPVLYDYESSFRTSVLTTQFLAEIVIVRTSSGITSQGYGGGSSLQKQGKCLEDGQARIYSS